MIQRVYFETLRKLFAKKPSSKQKQLKAILELAREIKRIDPDGLKRLIKLLGSGLQSEMFCYPTLYETPDLIELNINKERSLVSSPFFDMRAIVAPPKSTLLSVSIHCQSNRVINLATDLVISFPWHRDRITHSLCYIGKNKPWGEWEFDNTNHRIQLFEPWGLGFVYGGNHSIMAGILQGVGIVEMEYYYDASPIFQHVYTDGEFFIRKCDGKILWRVNRIEAAGIFEIGRLITED